MKKNLKIITFLVVLFNVFLASACLADIITPGVPYVPHYRGYGINSIIVTLFITTFIINLIIELFFGWLIFFRSYKKALIAVAIVNIISQPLAMFSLTPLLIAGFSPILPILVIESVVVIFEMLVYRFTLKEMPFKKAFTVSLSLNFLSFFLGMAILFLISILGATITTRFF